MRRWLWIMLVAGCYRASPQVGLPCSENGSCPGDQQCDQSVSPPTCVESLGDAGPDLDGPDGPQGCGAGCPTESPFCDPATQTCRGCIADAECESDACHELTGECISKDRVLFVEPGGTGTQCTKNAPCGRITDADNQRTATRNFIKLADGVYAERFELRDRIGSDDVILSGPDRSWTGPEITGSGGTNRVQSNLTAVIEGLSILEASSDAFESNGTTTLSHVLVRRGNGGVTARGPMTRILDCRIEQNGSAGVLVTGASVEIERTVIMNNVGGGLRIESGAGFSVTNTIIAANGTTSTGNAGVRILGTAPPAGLAVFRFNTVAGNRAGIPNTNGFECQRSVTIESSIMANPPEAFQEEMSGMCSAQTSLFVQGAPTAGGNLTGDPLFVSATDFHVQSASPAVNAAPSAMAPAVDVDGDPRSGADAPDIGADEVP